MINIPVKRMSVLGLCAILATPANAQNTITYPPIPGPFQVMLKPLKPLQPLRQFTRGTQQPIPYWMQAPKPVHKIAPNTTNTTAQNPTPRQTPQNQTLATAAQRFMPTPEFFPNRQNQPQQYRNQNIQYAPTGMQNFGAYYGQIVPNWRQNQSGYNPAYGPPNGYQNQQVLTPYGQPPRR